MVGKIVKCEHSNVVINVAYPKLKLQLHFRITFLLMSQLTFRNNNKRAGGGIRAGGLGKFGNFNKRRGDAYLVLERKTYIRYDENTLVFFFTLGA